MTRPVDDLLRRHRSGQFLRHLRDRRAGPEKHRRGIAVGDLLATMLASLGITKERVQQWARVRDCGCDKRQAWLNGMGFRQQERMSRILDKAVGWFGR